MNGWWAGIGPTFVVERLEQREVDDPEELQAALVHRRTAELHPQRSEHVVDQATSARGDQQEVAGLGAHRVDGPELLGLGQELEHRAVEPAAVDHPHPHQTRGTELLGPVDELVDLGVRHPALTGQPDGLDQVGLEGAELGGAEDLAQVDELEAEAHVGLVGAVVLLGLVPRHARHGTGARPGDRLGRVEHRFADHGHDVVGVGEAHLCVELHELELAVGAQVLVAQAAGDLVVAVQAADHEQLLEQLRALRERVELTRRQARRHHEVACALGRRRDQHRRLHLGEALRVERAVQRRVHLRAHAQVALETRTAEVDVAVPQAQHLVGLDAIVDGERRRLGLVEHLERGRRQLDLTGGQRVVDGALGPVAHLSRDPHDVLTADPVHVGADVVARVDDDLQDAGDVAHVEEHHPAVVATAVDPPAHDDLAVDVGGPEIAGAIGAHHCVVSSVSSRSRSHPATSWRGTSICSLVRMSFTATAARSASCLPRSTV